MSAGSEFGVLGLAVMGQNLARNVARNGIPVAVYNRTTERTERFLSEFGPEGPITGTRTIPELVAAIRPPRPILLMVQAGRAVDQVIAELLPHLDPGDIVIDGGNSYFQDTRRRSGEVEGAGFRFIGTGISGGEEGALLGPEHHARWLPGGLRTGSPGAPAHRRAGGRDALLHLHRAGRGGALRQDGAQRDRVRGHAADRRGVRPPAASSWG